MEAKYMEFGEAYEIMRIADDNMSNDKFFIDDNDKIHRIYDTMFETWNEEEGFWELVHEDIQDVMCRTYRPTCDPTGFHYTFTQAINMMRTKGVLMENEQYDKYVYKYDENEDTFVLTDDMVRFSPTGFSYKEVSGKWRLHKDKE